MGRPRAFDEDEVVRAAVGLFGGRAYDGISIDDLVTRLGVHRNSLYKTFGSKRGLYLTALRWHLQHQVRPLLAGIGESRDAAQALERALAGTDLGLFLLATVERAPVDPDVAGEINEVLTEFDAAGEGPDAPADSRLAGALTATILGLHLRARISADTDALRAGT